MSARFRRDLSNSTALASVQYLRRGLPRVLTDGSGLVSHSGAWQGFLLWAVGHQEIRGQFYREVGSDLQWRDEQTLLLFSYWATLRHWGRDGVPDKFLEEARRFFPDDKDQDGQ